MSDPAIDEARLFLRRHTRADLRFDEHMRPIKYVFGPEGRLVAPVMVAMLASLETVAFIPEAIDGALELLVTLEAFDEAGPHGALADRWRIYHGDPSDVRWAFLDIDAARLGQTVIDGEALRLTNALAADEAALCKEVNAAHRDDLRRLVLTHAQIEMAEPVMVGIDPMGLDVRGRFDVARVEAPEPMESAADARRVLEAMFARAANAGEEPS